MSFNIIEIKAKCEQAEKIRQHLKNADFRGIDHQIDTYFKVPNGRFKTTGRQYRKHLDSL